MRALIVWLEIKVQVSAGDTRMFRNQYMHILYLTQAIIHDGSEFRIFRFGVQGATRWNSKLASEVNLPHAINFRALCGANLVTLLTKFGGNEPFVFHRVVR